jgi:hypothetical protein
VATVAGAIVDTAGLSALDELAALTVTETALEVLVA